MLMITVSVLVIDLVLIGSGTNVASAVIISRTLKVWMLNLLMTLLRAIMLLCGLWVTCVSSLEAWSCVRDLGRCGGPTWCW